MVETMPSPTRARMVFLAGAADEPVDVRAHRHARDDLDGDAVLGHGGDARRGDDLRVDAHLHGFENVAAGQVDGGCPLERHVDARLVGRDQRRHDVADVPAREVVRLELIDGQRDAGFTALMRGRTICCGGTLRRRMPINWKMLTGAPDVLARATGQAARNVRMMSSMKKTATAPTTMMNPGATQTSKLAGPRPPPQADFCTVILFPATDTTTTGVPASTKSLSAVTSMRRSPILAMPDGRSGESATPA